MRSSTHVKSCVEDPTSLILEKIVQFLELDIQPVCNQNTRKNEDNLKGPVPLNMTIWIMKTRYPKKLKLSQDSHATKMRKRLPPGPGRGKAFLPEICSLSDNLAETWNPNKDE